MSINKGNFGWISLDHFDKGIKNITEIHETAELFMVDSLESAAEKV